MTRVIEQADLEAAFASASAAVKSGDPEVLAGRVRSLTSVTTLRQELGLSPREFASRYQIPLATLDAWERGTSEPDAVATAYLKIISADPVSVAARLNAQSAVAE